MKKFIFAAVVLCSAPAFANPLSQGSMTLGGSVRFPLKWDTSQNLTAGVDVVPSFSYFIFDQWELSFAMRIDGTLYQSDLVRTPKEPIFWGGELSMTYYFDFGWGVYPYLGLGVGAQMAEFKPTSSRLFLEMPVGVAFIVGKNVMIQVGAPVQVSFEGYGVRAGAANVEWSPGFIGGRVFF